jgi:hypothetical protein
MDRPGAAGSKRQAARREGRLAPPPACSSVQWAGLLCWPDFPWLRAARQYRSQFRTGIGEALIRRGGPEPNDRSGRPRDILGVLRVLSEIGIKGTWGCAEGGPSLPLFTSL